MRKLAIGFVLAIFSQLSFAQAGLTPANFSNVRSDFIARLALPPLETGESLLTRCAALVDKGGRLKEIVCYDNSDNPEASRDVAGEIRRVAQFYRLEPAMADGVQLEVWFNFSLLYQNENDVQTIRLVENHLLNASDYGVDYIAAQRFDRQPWRCQLGRGYFELVRAEISAVGEVISSESSGQAESKNCSEEILNAVGNSSFIPAQVDGNSVPSLYTEIFYVTP